MRGTELAQALLLDNIGQLATPTANWDDRAGPRRGNAMREVDIVPEAAVFCRDGEIVFAGPREEVVRRAEALVDAAQLIRFDCDAGVVIPGFCDSHTHPAFVLPRLTDFEKRIAGATYEEIALAGGGIKSSVRSVREASQAELEEQIEFAFRQMALQGTTTVEAKSGYGLDLASELKSLRAIRNVANRWAGTVYATFLGAHVVPAEYKEDRAEYVRVVCEEMLPRVAEERLADFVDVFCERGAFTESETEQIFAAAKRHRLLVRAHVGQFTAAALQRFSDYHPASFDHLDYVDEAGVDWLSAHNTVVTLVPGANFFLGQKGYPNVRRLMDAGVPLALATDYNPGTSPTLSMPFVMSLACTQMKMSPAEALVAATINGAHALCCADRKGSIQPGKDADLAVFGVDDYREIPYWIAGDLCLATVIRGELIA
jgi:imidazolonepropionase